MFKTDVSNLWKLGEEAKAIERLRYLSASLVLRRPKSTISLPSRKDLKLIVEFSCDERSAYDTARCQVITKIDEALDPGSEAAHGVAYANILHQIESLRLICNLGLHYSSSHREPMRSLQEDWASMAQATFDTQREIESMNCLHCLSNFEHGDSVIDHSDKSRENLFFRCLRFCCGDCTHKIRQSQEVRCGHSPACPQAFVSFAGRSSEEVASLKTLAPQSELGLPSKIQALVTDIKSLPKDTKW